MRNTCGHPAIPALPVCLGMAAVVSLFITAPAWSADCRFLQRTIPELRAQCTAGSYCPDLEAFKSQAKQTCGESYDPDGGSAGFEAPKPLVEASRPLPTPDPPPKVDQCTDIPTDRAYFEAQIVGVVSEGTRFLREGLQDLQKIKADLENEYKAVVGDAHSAREISTYMKQTVKTIAGLIDGLMGFAPTQAGAKVAVHSLEKWTAIIYKRYKAADRLLKSSDEILFEFSTDALAEMHLALKAAKVAYKFADNINTLRHMAKDMNEARLEYARQIGMLEEKIRNATLQIARSEQQSRARRVDRLVEIFKAVKERCRDEQPRLP